MSSKSSNLLLWKRRPAVVAALLVLLVFSCSFSHPMFLFGGSGGDFNWESWKSVTKHSRRGPLTPHLISNYRVVSTMASNSLLQKRKLELRRTPNPLSLQVDITLRLFQSPPKGAGKKVPRENCQKVSKNFLTFFDDFWRFLPCAKNVEKWRKTFWHFLTIFDVFWRGPFPPAPFAIRWLLHCSLLSFCFSFFPFWTNKIEREGVPERIGAIFRISGIRGVLVSVPGSAGSQNYIKLLEDSWRRSVLSRFSVAFCHVFKARIL